MYSKNKVHGAYKIFSHNNGKNYFIMVLDSMWHVLSALPMLLDA